MIRLSDILRATLLRFLPALVGGSLAITLLLNPAAFAHIPLRIVVAFSTLVALTAVGFGAVLWRFRYRLQSAANITGRRSLIAGGLAIVGLVFALAGQAVWSFAPYLAAAAFGAIAGAVMYWPWLRRPLSEGELAWESASIEQLSAEVAAAPIATTAKSARVTSSEEL